MKTILTISAMCICCLTAVYSCNKGDGTSDKLPDRIEVYPAAFKLGGDASRAQKDIRFETNAVSFHGKPVPTSRGVRSRPTAADGG